MTRGLGYRTGSRRCSISTNFWDATIYVQFQVGFTSQTKKKALVTLTEDGKIEVSKIETKDGQTNGPAKVRLDVHGK